eukprot:TRINITY_DN3309_c0_g2_i1.p3 TRINITY_DN3309_c0_g2~~TRINITY_DN3309_c0_g2_i1.p3  ORF type:complete len:100 (-),score=30.67 TRINITY_DN3309_c0_g2_i1:60-359(-)
MLEELKLVQQADEKRINKALGITKGEDAGEQQQNLTKMTQYELQEFLNTTKRKNNDFDINEVENQSENQFGLGHSMRQNELKLKKNDSGSAVTLSLIHI